jgi:hypothetical protein
MPTTWRARAEGVLASRPCRTGLVSFRTAEKGALGFA